MNSRISAAVIALAAVFGGCSEETGPLSTVPADLKSIEGQAEDAYDQALVGDIAAVAMDAAAIDAAWRSFRAQAMTDGATADVLAAMDAAVSGLESAADAAGGEAALARAANAVSAPMDELFALYVDPVPPAVLQLDYLGREVALDARDGDFDAAASHVDTIESAFDGLRDALTGDGGDRAAMDYDANVAALRADITAGDAEQLEVDANVGLELVDDMEGIFTKAAEAEQDEED